MSSYHLTPLTLQPSHECASTDTGFNTPLSSQTTLLKSGDTTSNHVIDIESRNDSAALISPGAAFSKHDRKHIDKTISRRVVILLGAMYSISLIDRTTTSVALVAGMGRDLDLVEERYNMLNAIVFIPLSLLALPSTVIVRTWGPRNLLTATTFLWGLTTIVSGFVETWEALLILRFMLGLWEAGLFPGCVYLVQCWFPRYDLGKANAGFFLLGLIPAAMSGLSGSGLTRLEVVGAGPEWWGAHLDNRSPGFPSYSAPENGTAVLETGYGPGVAGWRWIFFLNGTITCLTSIAAWFLLVDFPDTMIQNNRCRVKFLNKDEVTWAVKRISRDRQDVLPTSFDFGQYMSYIWDIKVWSFAALFGMNAFVAYAIAFSLPIDLIENLKFTPVPQALLMTAPPYLVAAILGRVCAHFSDKLRLRSPFLLASNTLTIIGLFLMALASAPAAKYTGTFFATLPLCMNTPAILAWQGNNVRGQWKRASAIAFMVGAGAIGGMAGSFAFRLYDAPHFYIGHGMCIGAMFLSIVVTLLLVWQLDGENKRAGLSGTEGLEGFKYTL
ncbi:Putative major facilitator superfamily, MFS transporter superfamily [Septoria linicola]|uniref:Major facilitator superfamily, MFS transporter superfamily n=1 Tax=Septoria linicola TaxID=215465 RepID=A0A9Q9AY96_9PEZI|nr:Putative major facilitator superfamily, MFS transporter superfamily [Septoria linicola]